MHKPLVRCPCCQSTLIFPAQLVEIELWAIIDRICPECGHRDRVRATAPAGAAWRRREQRIRDGLLAFAAALEDGLPWEVEGLPHAPTPDRRPS